MKTVSPTKTHISLLALVLIVTFITPNVASAQTTTLYQPQSREQIIAYLYGQIIQLQILLAERLAEEQNAENSAGGSSANSSSRADVEVTTRSAFNIEDDEAALRGRIDLDNESSARVWFEYGTSRNILNERTSRKTLSDDDGEIQTFTVTVSGLDDDERYYYRAVAEDRSGDIDYGTTLSFETDDRDRGNDNNDSVGDFELTVNNTSVSENGRVTVSWRMDDSDVNNQNWIGLYEEGSNNRDFVSWKYITSDDGSMVFIIPDAGDYEFRLFLNNSYNDEVTSRQVRVR